VHSGSTYYLGGQWLYLGGQRLYLGGQWLYISGQWSYDLRRCTVALPWEALYLGGLSLVLRPVVAIADFRDGQK